MRDLRDLQELRKVQGMDNTYRIAEAAKMLGVHPSTLRRWDEKGILPEAFEAACRRRAPKLLYVIPSIDNPTTATLPEERRRATEQESE